MEMPPSEATPAQLETLQDFSLQRRAQALALEPILRCRPLQLFDRDNSEFLVDLCDLVRAQACYREHFEHGFGNFLSHGIERRVRSGRVEPTDDVGNSRAYARDVEKTILGDEIGKRSGEREQAFRRPAVGASPVRIAAAQRGALPNSASNLATAEASRSGMAFRRPGKRNGNS